MDEYRQKIGTNGDSSTGLMMFDIKKMYPDAPVLIIDKSPEEYESAVEWCSKVYGGDGPNTMAMLHSKLSELKGMRVYQSDIFNKLPEIWAHLIGTPWKDEYADIKKFNIQTNPANIDVSAAMELLHEAV